MKRFPSLFPPPLSLKQDAALCLAGAGWVRGSARLHPAGEAAAAAAAAEPSLHNGAPGRGRGGACSEDGSRNGGSMAGTKERLSGWKGDVDEMSGLHSLVFIPYHQNLSIIPEQYR